ncbi:MAG: threonine--tRNA ligase, partial [Propionibacteriaceae bacterium]|nr:threonine--tRNA ligase [Propionibacteriaceae bacterium]
MSVSVSVLDQQSQTSEREVVAGTTAFELFGNDRGIVAARVNGLVVDLATALKDGDQVEAVAATSEEGLAILRHSCAHVAAQAVQRLHADAKLGIGPPITDGFYYDFDLATPFTPEDLKAIEKEMGSIVKERQRFVRRAVSDTDAAAELAAEPYKLELIGLKGSAAATEGASVEVGAGELTIYDNVRKDGAVAWKDLCRGPHVPHTGYLGNGYALTRSSAAYWRGDQANAQLQRLYGTAWASKDDLVAYRTRLEEAARRDHRKLG